MRNICILLFVTALVVSLSFIPVSITDNAVAIDFGTNLRVAKIKRGSPMDMVLNTESKRSTVAAIAIDKYERIFGGSAMHWLTRYPDKSFIDLASLLGKRIDSPQAIEYQKLHPSVNLIEDKYRPFGINIKHPDHEEPFTIEELVSYMLEYLKDITEKSVQEPISDIVIAVSPHFDHFARVALMQAAELANLKVLELIHDVSGAALQFSVSLNNATKDIFKHYIIYDIGATTSTASLVSFSHRPTINAYNENVIVPFVEVIETLSVPSLGGSTIDLIIRDQFIRIFESMNLGMKGSISNKGMIRLINEANRVKAVLTVNTDIDAKVESLVDDTDFRYKMTRSDLESWCQKSRYLFMEPIHTVLKNSNMSVETIEGLVLIGSGSRVPFLMEDIKSFVGDSKLFQTVNIEEGVSMGGCFRAAGLSKIFGVKDIRLVDHLSTTTFISEDGSSFIPLFPARSPLGSKKHITWKKSGDFDLNVYYSHSNNEKMIDLAKVKIKGVESALKRIQDSGHNFLEDPKIKITSLLSNSGILSFEKASLIYTYQETIPVSSESKNDTDANAPTSPTSSTGDSVMKTVNKTESILLNLEINFTYPKLNSEQILFAKKRMQDMRQFYALKRQKGEARNNVESYAYDLRTKLKNPEFLKYLKSDTKEALTEKLLEVLAKAEEDIDKFTIEEYRADFASLKEFIAPAELRQKNDRDLPEAISNFYISTNQTMKFIEKVRNISTEDVGLDELGKLTEILNDSKSWLEITHGKHEALPLYELPILSVSEIKKRMTSLDNEKSRLSTKFYTKRPKMDKQTSSKDDNKTDNFFSGDMKEKLQKMMEELEKEGKFNLTDIFNDTSIPSSFFNETTEPPSSTEKEQQEQQKESPSFKEHLDL